MSQTDNNPLAPMAKPYRTLFLSGLTQIEALAQLKAEKPDPIVQEWIDFIESAGKRGYMRPAVGSTELEEVA